MGEKFDPVKYVNDYTRQNYDRFSLTAPKGRKAEIKEAAKAAGMSLNEYILTAVAEKMGK
jgi:predicted HicB family RNase H-like nuclease